MKMREDGEEAIAGENWQTGMRATYEWEYNG